MTSKTIVITAPDGLHARPAGEIVKAAKAVPGVTVTLSAGGKSVSALSMISILTLGLTCGKEVTISADGGTEETEKELVETIAGIMVPLT